MSDKTAADLHSYNLRSWQGNINLRQPNGPLDPGLIPNNSVNGNPIDFDCFPFPHDANMGMLPHLIERRGAGAPAILKRGMKTAAWSPTWKRAPNPNSKVPQGHHHLHHIPLYRRPAA